MFDHVALSILCKFFKARTEVQYFFANIPSQHSVAKC